MTVRDFLKVLSDNCIPDDAVLWSDCDWEVYATRIRAVYYCKEDNIIALAQDDDSPIRMPDDWMINEHERKRKWVLIKEAML